MSPDYSDRRRVWLLAVRWFVKGLSRGEWVSVGQELPHNTSTSAPMFKGSVGLSSPQKSPVGRHWQGGGNRSQGPHQADNNSLEYNTPLPNPLSLPTPTRRHCCDRCKSLSLPGVPQTSQSAPPSKLKDAWMDPLTSTPFHCQYLCGRLGSGNKKLQNYKMIRLLQ